MSYRIRQLLKRLFNDYFQIRPKIPKVVCTDGFRYVKATMTWNERRQLYPQTKRILPTPLTTEHRLLPLCICTVICPICKTSIGCRGCKKRLTEEMPCSRRTKLCLIWPFNVGISLLRCLLFLRDFRKRNSKGDTLSLLLSIVKIIMWQLFTD